MLDASLFVSDMIHERKIKLGDDTEHVLWFKELPQIQFSKYQAAARSEDEEVRASSVAKLISLSLCEPNGAHMVTEEKAAQLKPVVSNAIIGAIMEINGFGGREEKKD
jgi:hypothetical protein